MTQTAKLIDETIDMWNRKEYPIHSTQNWLRIEFVRGLQAIKESIKSEADIDGLINQIKIQERGDTCPRWMSINEAKLRHIIEKHLSPKKEIDSQEIMKSTIPDLTDEEYKKNYTNPLSKIDINMKLQTLETKLYKLYEDYWHAVMKMWKVPKDDYWLESNCLWCEIWDMMLSVNDMSQILKYNIPKEIVYEWRDMRSEWFYSDRVKKAMKEKQTKDYPIKNRTIYTFYMHFEWLWKPTTQ